MYLSKWIRQNLFSTRYDLWRFKELNRRTFADNVLCDKEFNTAKDPKCDGYWKIWWRSCFNGL